MAKWFKTQRRRVKEEFLQAIGAHEATHDFAFDAKISKFHMLDELLHGVYNSFIAYNEAMNQICIAGEQVSKGLSALYKHDTSEFEQTARQAIDSVRMISNVVKPAVQRAYTDVVLKPYGKLLERFPEIHKKISKRHQIMLDYDSYKARLAYEQSRQSANVDRVSKKLEDAATRLHDIEDEISEAIEDLERERPSMLVNELSALISCQVYFYGNCSEILSELLPTLPQAATSMCLLESYAAQCEDVFEAQERDEMITSPRGRGSVSMRLTPRAPEAVKVPEREGRPDAAKSLPDEKSISPDPHEPGNDDIKAPHSGDAERSDLDRAAEARGSSLSRPVSIKIPIKHSQRLAPSPSGACTDSGATEEGAILPEEPPLHLADDEHGPMEPMQVQYCKAVFNFESDDPADLPFQVGEIIAIIEQDPSGWWIGACVAAFCCVCGLHRHRYANPDHHA
uniref:BAR domain-containing protein n=1 Tax=Phaeomonas parva TaxID=124430 RepID=A0A7S1UK45_9STRA|mmetsp:Transcript_9110/g.26593  ORF Transcript_9110/g.26593 Transcript_9110/m.26593 type:complete len:453 (+) Transcript_9110:369-1727(+)